MACSSCGHRYQKVVVNTNQNISGRWHIPRPIAPQPVAPTSAPAVSTPNSKVSK